MEKIGGEILLEPFHNSNVCGGIVNILISGSVWQMEKQNPVVIWMSNIKSGRKL